MTSRYNGRECSEPADKKVAGSKLVRLINTVAVIMSLTRKLYRLLFSQSHHISVPSACASCKPWRIPNSIHMYSRSKVNAPQKVVYLSVILYKRKYRFQSYKFSSYSTISRHRMFSPGRQYISFGPTSDYCSKSSHRLEKISLFNFITSHVPMAQPRSGSFYQVYEEILYGIWN